MENSGFFDTKVNEDGSYDRTYLASSFAAYFASFIGNGVFANKLNTLQVVAGTNMTIKVRPGQGWINGYWYENTDDLSLTIQNADGVYNRYDSIVLQLSFVDRTIRVIAKTGIPASSAQPPVLVRNADCYELALAYVYVPKGATSISQQGITDKRLDKAVCGFVTGVIDQIDTAEFYTQLDGFIQLYIDKSNNTYNDFKQFLDNLKESGGADKESFNVALDNLSQEANEQVNALIDEIRGLLDGDVATNLQNQIDKKLNSPDENLTGSLDTSDCLLNLGITDASQVDLSSVKAIKLRDAGVGRIISKQRDDEISDKYPQIFDMQSFFIGMNGETQSAYEFDKSQNNISGNSYYLQPICSIGYSGDFDSRDEYALVNVPTWKKLCELQNVLSDISKKLDDITFQLGEEVEIEVATAGYVTEKGKKIRFTVPLPKMLKANQTLSISSRTAEGYFKLTAVQNGKYICGSSSSPESFGTAFPDAVSFVVCESFASVTVTSVKDEFNANGAQTNSVVGVVAFIKGTVVEDG